METESDASQRRWEKKRLRAASVEMDREFFRGRPDHQAVSVLVHELMHSLGLQGHVDAPTFQDSNIYDAWFRVDGSLPAFDAAALQALYTRPGEETEPEALSDLSSGAWSRETIHLGGEIGDIAFGVRHGNGVSMPWTSGTEPSSAVQRRPPDRRRARRPIAFIPASEENTEASPAEAPARDPVSSSALLMTVREQTRL